MNTISWAVPGGGKRWTGLTFVSEGDRTGPATYLLLVPGQITTVPRWFYTVSGVEACRRYIQPQAAAAGWWGGGGSFSLVCSKLKFIDAACCPSALSPEAWLPEPFYCPAHRDPGNTCNLANSKGFLPPSPLPLTLPRGRPRWFHWHERTVWDGWYFSLLFFFFF